MGKQTKRTRKFVSSGGVKSRVQKKGTSKRKTKGNTNGRQEKNDAQKTKIDNESAQYMSEKKQERDDENFVSKKNLGELDIDSFFKTLANGIDDDDDDLDQDEVDEQMMSESDEDEDAEEVEVEGNKTNVNDGTSDKKGKGGNRKQTEEADRSSSSDDESDSEDDDIEAAENRMKEEMLKLKQKDPEFHQFLKENEDSLLGYGAEDDAQSNEEEGGRNDDNENMDSSLKSTNDAENYSSDSRIRLTFKLLEKYEKGAFKSHGIKALKKIVKAYKSACELTNAEEEETDGRKGSETYKFDSSDVFDRLMVSSLEHCKDEFHYHLLGDGSKKGKEGVESKNRNSKTKHDSEDESDSDESEDDERESVFNPEQPINPKKLERSHNWNALNPIIYTFFKSTIRLLSEAKDPQLLDYVLISVTNYIPYMTPFPRQAENMLKTLTALWSAPIDSSEDYQVVRLKAFLRIRQLALTQPYPFIEESLKKSYLAYAQRSKFATASSVSSSLPVLTFMGNCVVELYSLDYHSSYQHAFIYIRQLALHLRTAMQKKTPEAIGSVYCWQYFYCLKLWVAVLTEACQDSINLENDASNFNSSEDQLLRSLIFPLTQIILGTVRLIPSTRYLPLRLNCVRLLQQLAAAGEMFIPTTSILLDVFDLKELSQPPKKAQKSNVQPIALTLKLRKENPLRSMEELEMCLSDVFVLMNREIDLYQYSPGFPEFSVRICHRLKKFSKETRNGRWRAYAKGFIEVCNRYSTRIMQERTNSPTLADVAPKDVKQLEVLRPFSVPRMGERYKLSVEKEKRLEMVNKPVQRKVGRQNDTKGSNNVGSNKTKKKHSKKKQKKSASEKQKSKDFNPDGLEQEDEVEEGINWSDEE